MINLQQVVARLNQFVEQRMQAQNIPGVALALTNRERLLHIAAYGFADVSATTPLRPDHLFEIGSIGKSFTAIALLQLVEEGRLHLHAPLTTCLPWFEVQSEYEPITVHHLLSHTAGIVMGTDFAPGALYEVWALRETETSAPPGEHFHYSNVGYKALGFLLEHLSGQPYGDILQWRILDPLGMMATDAVTTNETRKRLAVGYLPGYDDRPSHPIQPRVPATWLEYGAGDGSPASTAEDMATYLRMLLNRGQGHDGRILSEASFALMMQRVAESQPGRFYGYGLYIQEIDGFTHIGHGGGTVGYVSTLLGDLDNGLGAIALANVIEPSSTYDIAQYALRLGRAALLDLELPHLPALTDHTRIERAAEFAGIYRAGDTKLTLIADGERLVLEHRDGPVILEQRGPDQFYVNHPDFALHLLRFGRASDDARSVVEAFHGSDWYINERYAGPTTFDYPHEWNTYPGHYRSHNPWLSDIRILLRKGALVVQISALGWELPLVSLGDGLFQVGEDERSPERIRIAADAIAGGQALRVHWSGCDFYRFFTP